MIDFSDCRKILTLENADLEVIFGQENDRFEFKSSQTSDNELKKKISCAASAFWNSGGGLFIAGVDDNGNPDGGISVRIGRQSREDWVDQVVSEVEPKGAYAIRLIEARDLAINIKPDHAVLLICFEVSQLGPHMAEDGRYYVRAGAHTLRAGHFLVEAIYARRGLHIPILKHFIRHKPDTSGVLQLGILCLNDEPALEVELELNPMPNWLIQYGISFPLLVPTITNGVPFIFDFHIETLDEPPRIPFQVIIKYKDLLDRSYEERFDVDVDRQLGPDFGVNRDVNDLVTAIREIAHKTESLDGVTDALERIARSLRPPIKLP